MERYNIMFTTTESIAMLVTGLVFYFCSANTSEPCARNVYLPMISSQSIIGVQVITKFAGLYPALADSWRVRK